MTDYVPETSDDKNSAKTKQTNFECGHCERTFEDAGSLGRHTVNCPQKPESGE